MKLATVIPCYKCSGKINSVIESIPASIEKIYLVDDACPENSGINAHNSSNDPRITLIKNETNQGVGGAVMAGYRKGLEDGMDAIIKIDGDGQMDPALIPNFLHPIQQGKADYTKGNRFYNLTYTKGMPFIRLLGNSALSFLCKMSAGYWNLMDPVNGFTAIHRKALLALDLNKIDKGYFFETDILFRLNLCRAVVWDIPMKAVYKNEISNLKPFRILPIFFLKNLWRIQKRFFYLYLLRDFNIGSLEILFGALFFLFGSIFGSIHWYFSFQSGIPATSGTVMIAGISVILGFQLLLAGAAYDIGNTPKIPLQNFH